MFIDSKQIKTFFFFRNWQNGLCIIVIASQYIWELIFFTDFTLIAQAIKNLT